MSNHKDNKNIIHKRKMEKLKENVNESIKAANIKKGVSILLTGNGKGKTSSAFGMVIRSLGYNYKVGIIQFIKGQQSSGEEIFVREKCPSVTFYQMGTGFTWNTQDRSLETNAVKDLQCTETFWSEIKRARQREQRQTRKSGYTRAL